MKFVQKNIEFVAQDCVLRGWLFVPEKTPAPLIILAHGFTALKEHDLDRYAAFFASNGFCVLVYDNRNFGESDATTPFEIDPIMQMRDYRHAITYGETLEVVDKDHIGIWGTSFSGGHVLTVAALDSRVKCVVSQVPFISGDDRSLRLSKPEVWQKRNALFLEERRRLAKGEENTLIAVVTDGPKGKAVMKAEDAYRYFTKVSSWQNKVTFSSLELSTEYEPIAYVHRITETPVLMIVSDNDPINPDTLAKEAFEKISSAKQLVTIDGGHFSAYSTYFEKTAGEACEWFIENLMR